MDSWKQYACSVILCAFSCNLLTRLVSDDKKKRLLNLVSGIFLVLTIVKPFCGLDLSAILSFSEWERSLLVDSCISDGRQAAEAARSVRIKELCEAYILDKAEALDAQIQVQVDLDHALIPESVTVTGISDPYIQKELQKFLIDDLGISKENQRWIWNQENSSS